MIFNSLVYLIFLPVVLLLLTGAAERCKWILLLAASYLFYMWWNPSLIVLILTSTAVSYFCALMIERSERRKVRIFFLTVSLVILFGFLFFFKYFNFFTSLTADICALFGLSVPKTSLDLILPVGISFYTFQTLSYVIDVCRGTISAESHFGYYALYVSFFPQLVAGPIERPENLLPQLKQKIVFTRENIRAGLSAMAVGYFKKIAAADLLAGYVNSVYNAPAEQSGTAVAIATLLFTIQIYCDFSGYSDIAVGTARLMGIRLMKNFDLPYSSSSVKEFWDRWHISLSSWLRDYLYFPLGGNRKGKIRAQINIFIVFLASGLWHGANLTFVLWGVVHGAARITENLLYPLRRKLFSSMSQKGSWILEGIFRIFTFVFISFTWIFFRANSISDLSVLLRALVTDLSLSQNALRSAMSVMGMSGTELILTLLTVLCLILIDLLTQEREKTADVLSADQKTIDRTAETVQLFWIVICAALLLVSSGGSSSFIYFQF